MDSDLIARKLKSMIVEKDEFLTHGHIAPILKQGKNMPKPESYKSKILLLVSQTFLSMVSVDETYDNV